MLQDFDEDYQKDLIFNPLFECKLVCLSHQSYPLSSLRMTSIKKLLDYPIIIYKEKNKNHKDILRLIHMYGEPKNIVFEEDFSMYHEMISSGFGIGFSIVTPFESFRRPYSDQIETIMLSDSFQIYAGYVIKKDRILSETSDVFLKYCKNYILRMGKAYSYYVY